MSSSVIIPNNFSDTLPALKEQTFQWRTVVHLSENDAGMGSITHYSVGDNARGNIVLTPGLASNTDSEPLMKMIMYWSLKNSYNIYAVNTFLGDFKDKNDASDAQYQTYPRFVHVVDICLNMVEKYCINQWTGVVAHSTGGAGVIDAFNNRVKNNQNINFSSVILFAPQISSRNLEKLKLLYFKSRIIKGDKPDNIENAPMYIANTADLYETGKLRYVSVMPAFLDDMGRINPHPELMNNWGTNITLVAAGKDRKVDISDVRNLYNQLQNQPNANRFYMIELQTSKHSFINLYKESESIMRVIKSQRVKKRNK